MLGVKGIPMVESVFGLELCENPWITNLCLVECPAGADVLKVSAIAARLRVTHLAITGAPEWTASAIIP